METLQLLGVALGLATLAGLNLYLTVFVTGLAVSQGWIVLQPQYEQLSVLADPVILWISGILFVLEFFADKVPWVDSLWDAVHTFIRPIGGAMLAITALGDTSPVYDVVVGLLAGGMALTTHGAKTGTRLLANASPEPFSNIALSITEDVTVLAGLALIYKYPVAALVAAIGSVAVAIWLAPRVLRAARTMLWFAWRRILHAFGAASPSAETDILPLEIEIMLCRERGEKAVVEWAVPCVSGPGDHLRGNTFGWLLLTSGPKGGLDFIRNVKSQPQGREIPIEGWKAQHRSGWVCDCVVLYEVRSGRKQTFQFDRSRRGHAASFAIDINRRTATSPAGVA